MRDVGLGAREEVIQGEHVVPITGALNYRHRSNSGVVVRLRAGPSFWIGQDGRDSEVLINYSGQVGYEVPKISLLGGITGRAIATEESLIGGGRTLHQLGAAVALGLGRLWPGMHVRIPVGSTMNQVLDFVVGFNVAIEIG